MTVIKIAIQKSGRLFEKSHDLLTKAGLNFRKPNRELLVSVKHFPAEILLLRNDDIPNIVASGACDIGIVGENVIFEKEYDAELETLTKLGFGHCRLSLAAPIELQSFQGKRIATSYPNSLKRYFNKLNIEADILKISGSVEITPMLQMADAICDLVSTGATLKSHGLVEKEQILHSEAVLTANKNALNHENKKELIDSLVLRLNAVLEAKKSSYIMMKAPKASIEKIATLLPGKDKPTVIPLMGDGEQVAIHMVAQSEVFWQTLEDLKKCGASSILVSPIEKMLL